MLPKFLKQAEFSRWLVPLLLMVSGCESKVPPADEAASAAVSLPIVKVQHQSVQMEVYATGTVSAPPNASAKISPSVVGKLAVVSVLPGDKVAQGQIIARLDNRQSLDQLNQATAALRSTQANVTQVQTNLELAQKTLERSRHLYKEAINPTQTATDPGIQGARAGVAQSQSNLALAKNNFQRQTRLFKAGIAAKKELFAAQNQVETAQAGLVVAQAAVQLVVPQKDIIAAEYQVETAKAALAVAIAQEKQASAFRDQARTQLSFSDIHSPISGIVASRFLNVGDTTDPTIPVVQVVNLSEVMVNANLPADQKAHIHVGQIAHIRSLTGGNYSGVVTAVSPIVDTQSNSRSIKISINNFQTQLRENQTVTVAITTEIHPQAITVPQTALVPDPENPTGRMVYTVQKGQLMRKKVQTGIQQGDRIEILSGLTDNESIVPQGAYGLADGTPIKEVK
jgi:RND family efflux transporter MFP subunit